MDKKRKNDEKKIESRKKKKELERQTAEKASCMVAMGPMNKTLEDECRDKKMNIEKTKIKLVHDFMINKLEFQLEDMDDFNIMETRIGNEGIINVAFECQEQAKEVYIRKSEIMDDDIIVRQYIPPGYYDKFMHLNNMCKEARSRNPDLKTQLRFGKKNIELFVKFKGEGTPFKLAKLEDFMDTEKIPCFDHKAKWKRFADRFPRRLDVTRRRRQTDLNKKTKPPFTGEQSEVLPQENLRRQISTSATSSGRDKKKSRTNT